MHRSSAHLNLTREGRSASSRSRMFVGAKKEATIKRWDSPAVGMPLRWVVGSKVIPSFESEDAHLQMTLHPFMSFKQSIESDGISICCCKDGREMVVVADKARAGDGRVSSKSFDGQTRTASTATLLGRIRPPSHLKSQATDT